MSAWSVQAALLSEVLDGDVPPIESSESFLEVSVNATNPGAVLIDLYFWMSMAKEQGIEYAEEHAQL